MPSEASTMEPSASATIPAALTTSPIASVDPAPSSAERLSSQRERLVYIDCFRGFACLWVILCHAHAEWMGLPRPQDGDGWLYSLMLWFFGMGGKGVDLFIVISGFCLAYPVWRRAGESGQPQIDVRKFYVRRALRIGPVYLVAVALAAVWLSSSLPAFAQYRGPSDVVPYLFFVQNMMPDYTARLNGTLWSVAMEMQLYVIFPPIVLLTRRTGLAVVVAIAVALSIAAAMADRQLRPREWPVDPFIHTAMLVHLGQFALGALAARLVLTPRSWHVPACLILGAVAGPLALLTHTGRAPATVDALKYTAWATAFAAAIVLVARTPLLVRLGESIWLRWLATLGLISYSVYVVHFPVMLILKPTFFGMFGTEPMSILAAFTLTGLPAILLVGAVLFFAVERFSIPSVRLERASRRSPSPAVVHA